MDGLHERPRPPVADVVPVHRRDHRVIELQPGHRLTHVTGLIRIEGGRLQLLDGTEPAGTGAPITIDHEGGGAVGPALVDVGAAGFLAHGGEVEAAHELLEIEEAGLSLEIDLDPVGALDIEARPGGKKMISLRSMSGGEKTLTTLAFIFAVQEFQPSPFYIMDEVDAALDKENSERLGMLISEYSKTSQFIIISHNDSVISQGDNIFGVHMNELGESRVVSIKLPAK